MANKVIFGRPDIRRRDIDSMTSVLRSGWIGMGPVTARLEQAFVKFTGAKYAVAVSSGSAGLFLSLLASGIGRGDEVITSPMTFPATANEVLHTGADVRFVDIDDTGNIDVTKIERAVTPRTRAILPVHLYGRPCDMDEILRIAKKHNLLVIGDAAHAFGATYHGQSIGAYGYTAVFSLYATKNVTSAEGGVITTNHKDLAEKMKLLRAYGITKTAWARFGKHNESMPYDTLVPGYNFEIPDLLSALALSQIKGYVQRLAARKKIWTLYDRSFRSLELGLPPVYTEGRHGMHIYAVRVDKEKMGMDRAAFMHRLMKMGIGTGIHFVSLHLHSYYKKRYGYKPGDFPAALALSRQTLSLPLSSGMGEREARRVIHAVKQVCDGNG